MNPERNDPGTWILEQLTLLIPDVEMATGRRAWREAVSAWPGQENRLWWKWATEAAQSIGMSTRTIDCTPEEAVDLADTGVRVLMWRSTGESADAESHGEWLALSRNRNHRFEVLTAADQNDRLVIKKRALRNKVRSFAVDGRVRCVVFRDQTPTSAVGQRNIKPLARLTELLRPEFSDIWIVMVFAFVTGLLMLATPIAVESLVNTVAFGQFLQPVIVLALILLVFLAFSAALKALQTYVVEIVQRRLFARVAGDLAWRLPRATTESSDDIYVPELTNRFFDIVTVQKVAAQLLLDGVGLVLSAFIGMAVLAFYHPFLLGFDIVMMAAIAFIILILGRGAVGSAIKESKHKYYMAAWLEDISRCPTVFRSEGGRELALERTDRLIHEYLVARGSHFRILMRQIVFALGLQAVASTALLGLGGWLVIKGELTLGQLVAAELIVTVIVGAFAKLGKHMESYYDLLAAVDKLGALFDLKTERQNGVLEFHATGPAELKVQGVTCVADRGGSLREATSFRLAPGDSLSVVGRSGSGKSTLLEMIYGMRPPTTGNIAIDDFDPMEVRPDVFRRHVAMVRSGEIFQGTLEENIHLHRADIAFADIREALAITGLTERVTELPDGNNTRLNSNGAPLSRSQRDLIGLARAIAGRPRLLLIDGMLDVLSDEELDHVLTELLAANHPWSVVISTGREQIAERCRYRLRMKPGSGQPNDDSTPMSTDTDFQGTH